MAQKCTSLGLMLSTLTFFANILKQHKYRSICATAS